MAKKPTKEELMARINGQQNKNLSILRDRKCIPLAIDFLKEVTSHPELVNALGMEAEDKAHKKVSKEMQLYMIEKLLHGDVKLLDAQYVFRIAHAIVDLLNEIMQLNIEENVKRADQFVWGKESKDLTFKDLHNVLEQVANTGEVAVIDKVDESVVDTETAEEKPVDEKPDVNVE